MLWHCKKKRVEWRASKSERQLLGIEVAPREAMRGISPSASKGRSKWQTVYEEESN
jgi:hypothetical protein